MGFKDEPWSTRIHTMGDTAEKKFEEVSRCNYVRTGLHRPPIKLQKIPPKVRYMPDYLTHCAWVECMGYGRDQTLKCKTAKWTALWEYHDEFAVELFLWDSHNNMYHHYDLEDFNFSRLEAGMVTKAKFPEGNPYWAFDMRRVTEHLQGHEI